MKISWIYSCTKEKSGGNVNNSWISLEYLAAGKKYQEVMWDDSCISLDYIAPREKDQGNIDDSSQVHMQFKVE